MADRVFLHIGLPKTGTSHLQTILWSSRDRLRTDGVLLPGRERRDHLWSSRIVRDDPRHDQRPPRQQQAWDVVRTEIADWPGTAVLSHEFFAAASAEQASRMVEQLAPAEVHLVVTAREPLGLFTASWQESLKNRETVRIEDYARTESPSPEAIWNWRTLDLALVLQRWGDVVPAGRVHVLPGARPGDAAGSGPSLWQRFAELIGVPPGEYDESAGFANASMGVVEAETLRRVNLHLQRRGALGTAFERGVFVRTHLADERLVPRGGDRFWPTEEQVEDCRRRGERAVALVRERGYDVRGDLDALLVPARPEQRRRPDSVTDTEVAELATDLAAELLTDVRRLRAELAEARSGAVRATPPAPSTDTGPGSTPDGGDWAGLPAVLGRAKKFLTGRLAGRRS